jgi:polysaccharide deacetylase family sporulation protein PdaB
MIKRVERAQEAQKEKKRWAAGTLCAIALLCALSSVYVSGTRTAEVVARKRELPIYAVDRSDNKIAISFDAAWGGDKTEKILDILDEYGVKTTFFMVDIWTRRFPGLVKEIAARGHEIGNHSATHPKMSTLSREKIRRELDIMADNAQAVAGVRPTLFRPPYGDYNNDVVLTARAAGYEVIQWSVDSLDWKNKGAQPLIDRATKNVKSGDIVLFHNDSQYILDALPTILKSYREQGFTIVPVSQLLLPGETTIDAQGIQRPASTTLPEV